MQRIIQKYKALLAIVLLTAFCMVAPLGYAQAATPGGTTMAATADCASLNSCTLISKYIDPFVNFLAAAVGVGVVVSIVIGGIQYSSSAGDPGKASAAKNRIRNAIIALITFMLLYGMLNFLIPGGFGILQ
ncbi:MAG TPA: hypothetical protein VMB52_01170 [Verrucomicrobiae bacterium]|nr:hypothetical protein [Verrucomicrobiae bacterium]